MVKGGKMRIKVSSKDYARLLKINKELEKLEETRSKYWTVPEPTTDAAMDCYNSEIGELEYEIEELENKRSKILEKYK